MSSSTRPSSSPETTKVVQYRHICPTCGRAFQRATGLERHYRSAHSKEKAYACEFCSQVYSRTDLLQRHISLYHKRVAASRHQMPQGIDCAVAQQFAMLQAPQELSTAAYAAQQSSPQELFQTDSGFSLSTFPQSSDQQQQQQQPLVNNEVDQDEGLLDWFDNMASNMPDVFPFGPITEDSVNLNVLSTASASSSCPLSRASSKASSPMPMRLLDSSSCSESLSATEGFEEPQEVSPRIEALLLPLQRPLADTFI